MKVGFVSVYNPFVDKKAWSGSIYKLRESIENAGYEVVWIPYKNKSLILSFVLKILRLFIGKNICGYEYNRIIFKLYALTIDINKCTDCSFLFFPGGAQIACYLKIKKPIVYFADANFRQLINYYWKDVNNFVIREGEYCERKGINNAAINIRSSKWAADSVICDYGFNSKYTFVLPLGPTLDYNDIKPVNPSYDGTFNILFSGVDWERKGGDIAVETVKLLRYKGFDVRLYIVGISKLPTYCEKLDFIVNVGFLNKNIKVQYEEYISTIRKCNIFLLPTKAECAGIVFSEASAFGLPIFTYNTGGIGDYVLDGINGYKLSLNSLPIDFANIIERVIKTKEIEKLYIGCLKMYNERLSWKNWSESFKKIISETLEENLLC